MDVRTAPAPAGSSTRSPGGRAQAATLATAVILLALMAIGCLDLAWREVARRSLVAALGLPSVAAGRVVLGVAVLATLTGVLALVRFNRARRIDWAVAMLLVAAFAAGLYTQQRFGARLQSDGFYYYAYLRSIWFDRDVDFTNDYQLLGLGNKPYLFQPTATGHAQSAWTIG